MIALKELVEEFWDAVGILRGHADPSDFKNYLLRLLLLKQLSDKHKTSNHNQAVDIPDKHRFVIPKGSCWSDLQHLKENVGDELNKAFAAIESANPKLRGIFSSNDWKRVSDELLLKLIQHVSFLSLQNRDLAEPNLLGYVCEELIERFALSEDLKNRLSTTPRQVTKLMVCLIEPQEGMQICDPVCGSGGLLVECTHQIESQEGKPQNMSLYGQARNRESWATTQINLLLHNISDFDIRLGDTLRDPQLVGKDEKLMRFDRVIANLPFNINNWGGDEITELDREKYNRFCYGTPPNKNGNYAFIQHIIATLKETGRAAVLIPHGALSQMGDEAQIRADIIKDDLIEAVIGLPPKLFFGTSIPAVILVLNRSKEEDHQGKILLIDASHCDQAGKRQNYLRDEDIEQITSAYRNFQDEEGYAKVVSCEELAAHNYDLSIHRYVTFPKLKVDLAGEINKLRKLKDDRAGVAIEMNECLRTLGIRDLTSKL